MLETMSQFASEKDLHEARAIRFARALVDIMDGIKDHDIQGETGLPVGECEAIAEARNDALILLDLVRDDSQYNVNKRGGGIN